VRYERYADQEPGGRSRDAKQTSIARALPRIGSKMLFLFDYGDEWRFRVEVRDLDTLSPGDGSPKVTAVVGKAPQQYSSVADGN
jgi:Plasmid pRiA4b ORF-3-like protein